MSCLANFHRTILKENTDELLRALAKRNIPGVTSRKDLLIEKNSCGSDALIFACLTGNIEIIHIINDALKIEGASTNNKERNAIDYLLEHMTLLEEKIMKLKAFIMVHKEVIDNLI
jgi:ankyrin repeat protein